MYPARLLLLIVLSCSLLAFGQTQRSVTPAGDSDPVNSASSASLFAKAATPSEPWRIIPQKSDSPQDALSRIVNTPVPNDQIGRKAEVQVLEGFGVDDMAVPVSGGTTCFAIRSYVVARDSKDSDATHPVAYSTCQPATRYRLRKTVTDDTPKK